MIDRSKRPFDIPKNDLTEALLAAYSDVIETETFPINSGNVIFHNLNERQKILQLSDGESNTLRFDTDYDWYEDRVTIELRRISLLQVDSYNVFLTIHTIRSFDQNLRNTNVYSFYKNKLDSLFQEIVSRKLGDSGEIIKYMSIRLLNLYKSRKITKEEYENYIGGIFCDKYRYTLSFLTYDKNFPRQYEFIEDEKMPNGKEIGREELEYYSTGIEFPIR